MSTIYISPLFSPLFNYIKHVPLMTTTQKVGGITADIVVTRSRFNWNTKESLLWEDRQSNAMQSNVQVSGIHVLSFPTLMVVLDRTSPRVRFYRWWLLNLSLIFGLTTKHCRRARRTTRRLWLTSKLKRIATFMLLEWDWS